MGTLLEGLFKDIITRNFFTETQVRIIDSMGNQMTNTIESTATVAVRNLINRSGFYESIKDVMLDRLIKVINSGEMDEVIAKSTGEFIRSSLGSKSRDTPAFIDGIRKSIPGEIASQLLKGNKDVLSHIDIKGLNDKIKNGEIKISISL